MSVSYAQPRVGVGVLVIHDGQVLLGQRAAGTDHGTGEMSLPAGRVEPGETPIDTARRELTEETGLEPVNLRPLGVETTSLFPAQAQHWVSLYFVSDWDGTPPVTTEPDKCLGWDFHPWPLKHPRQFSGLTDLQQRFPDVTALLARADGPDTHGPQDVFAEGFDAAVAMLDDYHGPGTDPDEAAVVAGLIESLNHRRAEALRAYSRSR